MQQIKGMDCRDFVGKMALGIGIAAVPGAVAARRLKAGLQKMGYTFRS